MPELSTTRAFAQRLEREKERRIAPRVPIRVRVECKTARIFAQARAEDISETGMLLNCAETFEVSKAITLRFELPLAQGTPASSSSVIITTAAVVARADRGRWMGVQFVGLRPAFHSAIAAYIARTAPAARKPGR
jgi:c-di-GMP-binding flagellar brake protein YcgR